MLTTPPSLLALDWNNPQGAHLPHLCLPCSTMYWDDRYGTETVSHDVLGRMKQLMVDNNTAASHSFLLDDDSSIPFSLDDISQLMEDKVGPSAQHTTPAIFLMMDSVGLEMCGGFAAMVVVVEARVLAALHASSVCIVLCANLAVQLSPAGPIEVTAALYEVGRVVPCPILFLCKCLPHTGSLSEDVS